MIRKLTAIEWKKRRERDEEMMRLVRDGSPEAMVRWMELLEETGKDNERRRQEAIAEQELQQQAYNRRVAAQQRAAMQVNKGQILSREGDFRTSNLYKKSQVIYDLTVHFCGRFITDYHDRTKDQMVQAARSGKQNFIEGWEDGQSNTQNLLHLFTIAKGSLQELREDYEDYLRTHQLMLWSKQHPHYKLLTDFCRERNDVTDYEPLWSKMNSEELANMALTILHQTDRMADSFIRRKEREALEGGHTQDVQHEINDAMRRARRGY